MKVSGSARGAERAEQERLGAREPDGLREIDQREEAREEQEAGAFAGAHVGQEPPEELRARSHRRRSVPPRRQRSFADHVVGEAPQPFQLLVERLGRPAIEEPWHGLETW